MPEENYRSTAFVSLESAKAARGRAAHLGISVSQIARTVLVMMIERGQLPKGPPEISELEDKVAFPFALEGELVEALGGKDRARDYARWAIVEGLELSPLAPPKDVDQ